MLFLRGNIFIYGSKPMNIIPKIPEPDHWADMAGKLVISHRYYELSSNDPTEVLPLHLTFSPLFYFAPLRIIFPLMLALCSPYLSASASTSSLAPCLFPTQRGGIFGSSGSCPCDWRPSTNHTSIHRTCSTRWEKISHRQLLRLF